MISLSYIAFSPTSSSVVSVVTLLALSKGWLVGSDVVCQSRSIRLVGEGSEEGRRAIYCYSLVTIPRVGLRK